MNKNAKEPPKEDVAEMLRRIAELEKAENTLRRLADISDRTGTEYFHSTAAFIAEELGTEYAIIGILDPEKSRIKTIAAYAHGKIIENIEYVLRGTPCDNVIGKHACFYPDKIQSLFPDDRLLATMKAESYAGIPLFASDGRPLGILVTLGCRPMDTAEKERCISLLQIFSARVSSELERKEAEDNIKKVKSSLASAQQIARLGNWEWDITTNKLWWSDETYRIFGLDQGESAVTYGTFLDRIHPDDREFIKKSVGRALYEKEPYNIDHRIVLPDGSEKIVHEQAEVTFDETGEPVHMLGTVQDVTELRQMETALLKSKEELETRVKERTAELRSTVELLQNEINERQKAENNLQKSLSEKEVLLKEIHHRVKNNMAVITSMLQLQSNHIKDNHYKDIFRHCINRINSMALIHEKLYRSKDLANINFHDYMKDMINSMFMSYGSSSRKVSLKINVEEVALGVDNAIPCGLIINELVTNSLKHAFPDNRKGEIHVSLRKNDKGEIVLKVGDNGIGMPEAADSGKTDSLGLTLVNALVRQLRGSIGLNREKGTEFMITFKEIAA